jgi:DNA-binding MarR family transcriptional regulator
MEYVKIIRAFGVLNRTFLSYTTKSLIKQDISYSDSIFLVNIGQKEGTTQEEIANSLAIDKAAIARSVKSMNKKGYVKVVQSTIDKRAKELYLTSTGKELYQFLQKINSQWMDSVLEGLSAEQVEAFGQTIDKICMRAKDFSY